MKNLFVLLAIAIQFASCNSKKNQDETKSSSVDSTAVKTEKTTSGNVLVYEGLLPCADCSGIQTVLKIYQGNGTMEQQKFEVSSIYKGKSPEKEFIETGNFNTERGLENDPNGTIFILNWDKPLEKQLYYGYLSSDTTKIYMLDRDKKIIKSKLNYTLDLKK
ncbi:copper resistance protein NlpE N-terminal domain-containing protein [Flavobacterium defluvii]|uniref:NlpE N-terminal domain-containing protein n=1 Tax=Flavobacterium defluvii TaxID=370979 RepID=A0A1M5VCI3_9FLAO|nr:copper resistance protein NlpE N-terminal domain-containing protein [Flavobacterium defluvii]SHH72814.1 NlpE N-terminal domain-containing protein [Flavobacterium defluvii]